MAEFDRYLIGDVFSEVNEQYRNRLVGDIAAERGKDPFKTIVDIVAADDLRTVLWPSPASDARADWEAPTRPLGGPRRRARRLRRRRPPGPHAGVALSDPVPGRLDPGPAAGVARAGGAADDRRPRPAVRPARSGPDRRGFHADIAVLDPATVDAAPVRTVFDLPGEDKRLLADPIGVVRVLVNGQATIEDGQPVGSLPGKVLRNGRDTADTSTI